MCVKIQFIKTFILPYFDYCSTLCIYYSIDIIQKLANTYNNCLFKLVNTKQICNLSIQTSSDFNKWNNLLSIYSLNSYQHRILFRLHIYIYKIIHYKNSPRNFSILHKTYNVIQQQTHILNVLVQILENQLNHLIILN